ncbi:hypothetical protein EV131_120102 [Rhizobium laguerreae]|uniref:Integrase-like protein n=1 Tax=Rhizobium laguerreae TaxID=1076926 RepID=A0AAX2QDP5_9HYPH|nr:hypothetical protein EV131_120102 [Rhizobium laguerreae]
MTFPSFETIKRWKLIEDWPHRASVDAVITSMVDKGYSSETMLRAVRFIGAFVECQNRRHGGEPERLDAADIDQFIASRLSTGAIENGNRIALRRLQIELVRAGVLCPPAEKAEPTEKVATLFGAELHRRGYSKHSISGHVWSARRFLRTVWAEHSGVPNSHTSRYGTIWRTTSKAGRATPLGPGSPAFGSCSASCTHRHSRSMISPQRSRVQGTCASRHCQLT